MCGGVRWAGYGALEEGIVKGFGFSSELHGSSLQGCEEWVTCQNAVRKQRQKHRETNIKSQVKDNGVSDEASGTEGADVFRLWTYSESRC